MNKLLIALLTLSAVASLAATLKQEVNAHLAQLRAEINANKKQLNNLQQEIARKTKTLAQEESRVLVRAAEQTKNLLAQLQNNKLKFTIKKEPINCKLDGIFFEYFQILLYFHPAHFVHSLGDVGADASKVE